MDRGGAAVERGGDPRAGGYDDRLSFPAAAAVPARQLALRALHDQAADRVYPFHATAGQAAAFTRRLQVYRPKGELRVEWQHSRCSGIVTTDQETVEITWQNAAGGPDRLVLYEGCEPNRNRRMIEAVRSAPGLLPIGDLIGHR